MTDVGNPAISVWHNLLWSPYKAGVFTALSRISEDQDRKVAFYQICETQKNRQALSSADRAIHQYPYELLFNVSQHEVFPPRLWWRVLRRTMADQSQLTIIAGLDSPAYWLQAIYLRFSGRKGAVFYDSTAHDQKPGHFRQLAKRAFFAMVGNTLSYGVRAREFAIAQGVAPERAFIRCQAAYLAPDYDAEAVITARTAMAPQQEKPVFLFVGRCSDEKGLAALLTAFGNLLGSLPNATLRLVGDGPDLMILRDRAQQLPNPLAVQFVGSLSGEKLQNEYLQATALILPSRSEPWGLVVNEALHFGCPVVVSDRCGCVPELVENSPCGITFSYGDAASLEGALYSAARWADDPALVAAQCLEKIAPYNADNSARQILGAIDTIMGKRG